MRLLTILGARLGAAGIALSILIATSPLSASAADVTPDVVVKAAFLYNFAKFAEWPDLAAGAPIVVCIVGNEEIATAFVQATRGRNISGHPLDVWRLREPDTWRVCNMLFIADADAGRAARGLGAIATRPILTVSDREGFSQTGGIVEFYLEGGRMRFAINADAAERSGLHLSSRLLGLAKVTRNGDVR